MRPTAARFLSLSVVSASALLLLACPDTTIRLGAVVPATGVDQAYGESIQRGIEIAYEEFLTEEGKPSIELLPIADSASDPEIAAEKLRELYDAGAFAVIGGVTTDEVQKMLEVADRYDRVLLSPSASSPELTSVSSNFYRIWPSDFTSANKMADFAILDCETVIVVVERTYGKGIQSVFQAAFEEDGGKVLEVIEIPPHTSDFSGIAERILTLNPDAVYLAAYEVGVGGMIQELRRMSYEGKILTTSAFATTSAIARIGQDAEGVFLTQTFFDSESEFAHVKRFVKPFREKYGVDPDIYAAHGYDAFKVLVAAIEGVPPNLPGDMQDGMRDVQEFEGVTGSIQFNEKGDVQKYPRVYVIGEDLALYDYNERVKEQRDELRRKREELQRRLEQIRLEASSVEGS
jgi:branched-chain amino acid transport system substrate-binding protein